nr:right-handed parallel beta-helix repeat-containing protein [Deltaproteobacteria bacterium]
MHDLRRTPSNLLTPAIGALLLLTGCTLPDLGDATTDGTDGNDTGASDGADSTGGVPGDCAPLEQTDIDTDATLPAGCYEVSTLLFLESRLELSPDAQLYFGANTGLQVFGSGVLVAVGTVDAPVLMTSAQGQGWSGIQLSGAASSENQLDWVRIEDAAADAVALDPSSRLQVSNSEISGAGGFGFTASPGAEFTLATTVIEDCAVPVAVGLDGVEGIAADNTLTTNTEAVVQVEGGTLADDAQWIDPGVPLQLTGNAFIEGALGVGPGLEIEMPQDAEFSVATAGSLTAEGTAEAPIVLRGIQDERGYWQGISFASNDSANILRHCEVANGGSDGWNGSGESVAAVWLAEQSRLEMSDSTIRASDGAALTSFGGANMTGFANNRIEDNRQTIKVSPNMIDEIEASNTFVDNDEAYVRVGRPGANNE